MLQTPEVVTKFDAACERLHTLLERFCEHQGIPATLLNKVAHKVRFGRVGDLTSEEVSPAADALDPSFLVEQLGYTADDPDIEEFGAFFRTLANMLLTNDIRQDFTRLARDIDQGDICQKCLNSGRLAVLCNWCQNEVPHDICEHDFTVFCDCRKGGERRKRGEEQQWHGWWSIKKERNPFKEDDGEQP